MHGPEDHHGYPVMYTLNNSMDVCMISKHSIGGMAKMPSRRTRDTISGSKYKFLRTASSLRLFPIPLGIIFKVTMSYFKVKLVIFL